MKSLLGLAGGGSIGTLWARLPAYVKIPVVVGVVTLSGAELVRDINQALVSGSVTAGEGAKGAAQVVDPVQTRARMNAGKTVSGAERSIVVQYEKEAAAAEEQRAKTDAATDSESELRAREKSGENTSTETLRLVELQKLRNEMALRAAEALEKAATAQAANESEAELLEKIMRGIPLTSVEQLKLSELQKLKAEAELRKSEAAEKAATATAANESEGDLLGKIERGIPLTSVENLKLQEIRQRRAEASIKTAEETAAAAQARANKAGAEMTESLIQSMKNKNGGYSTDDMMQKIWNGQF